MESIPLWLQQVMQFSPPTHYLNLNLNLNLDTIPQCRTQRGLAGTGGAFVAV